MDRESVSSHTLCLYVLEELLRELPDMEQLKKIKTSYLRKYPLEFGLKNMLSYVMLGKDVQDVTKRLHKIKEYLVEALDVVRDLAKKRIKKGTSIFVFGHSATVLHILEKIPKSCTILLSKGGPYSLGRSMANDLVKLGFTLHYFDDLLIRQAMKDADMVLMGADAIDHHMHVYDKAGCELVAEIAQHRNVPVYVCSETIKFSPDAKGHYEKYIKDGKSSVVWPDAPKQIIVEHYKYERVRPALITGFITELGILRPEELLAEIRHRHSLW